MIEIETRSAVGPHGRFAESLIPLCKSGMGLKVLTMKRSSGALVTTAGVVTTDGCFETTQWDSFKKTLKTSAVRCTAAAVLLQHRQALATIEAVMAEALAHYAKESA